MNKLERFTKRLREIGLSERQIDEAVYALSQYDSDRIAEENAQQGRNGVE